MRQQNDSNFVTFLQRFHIGIPNNHDVEAINLRHKDFNIVTTTFELKHILFTSNLF